jgi:hypothetical protein
LTKQYERELADEELSRLLVTTNLTESDGTRAVTMGLLDTTSGGGRLAGGLGSELLARSLASGAVCLCVVRQSLVELEEMKEGVRRTTCGRSAWYEP